MADKVLVVSFYFPPMNGPATQHPTWFYRFLPEHGLDTIVLTSSTYIGENTDESSRIDDPRIRRVPERESHRKLSSGLHRIELKLQNRVGLWDHGFPWSYFALREASRLMKTERITSMVSTSPSVASHWAAYLIKKRFPEIRWIADFTDPLVGNPFRNIGPTVAGLERRLEQVLFREADFLSANTDTVLAMWQERYPAYRDKMIVTWNGYDPEERISARPIPADRTGRVLCHVGSVYGSRVPHAVLAGLHRVWQRGLLRAGELTMEFFGYNDFSGVKNRREFEALQAAGIVQVHNEYAPRSEALRVAEEADYLLLLDVTYPHNTKLQVPSKLFDYIRIGRPILAITPAGSPTESILAKSGIPHVVLHTEAAAEEIDAGILRLLTLPAFPRPATAWFSQTFDARRLTEAAARLMRGHEREMTAAAAR